jgi:hypothetical protein
MNQIRPSHMLYLVSHAVFGCARRPGGQWSEKSKLPLGSGIETLSYAEMLSLPGYTFGDYYKEKYAQEIPGFTAPVKRKFQNTSLRIPHASGLTTRSIPRSMWTMLSAHLSTQASSLIFPGCKGIAREEIPTEYIAGTLFLPLGYSPTSYLPHRSSSP